MHDPTNARRRTIRRDALGRAAAVMVMVLASLGLVWAQTWAPTPGAKPPSECPWVCAP